MTDKSHPITIIRAKHGEENPYFQMMRGTAQDRELSFAARGMLSYLMSRSDNWKLQPKDLQQKCGKNKVYSLLNELIEKRYIIRAQECKKENNQIIRWHYVVHEKPLPRFPEMGFPEMGFPEMENSDITYYRIVDKTECTKKDISPKGDSASAATIDDCSLTIEKKSEPLFPGIDGTDDVPTWIKVDGIGYHVVVSDDHAMQIMGSDNELLTLYSVDGTGNDDNLTVCWRTGKVTYGREHSKSISSISSNPQSKDANYQVLAGIERMPYQANQLKHTDIEIQINTLHQGGMIKLHDGFWHITDKGRVALEAWQSQQPTLTVEEADKALYSGDDSNTKVSPPEKPCLNCGNLTTDGICGDCQCDHLLKPDKPEPKVKKGRKRKPKKPTNPNYKPLFAAISAAAPGNPEKRTKDDRSVIGKATTQLLEVNAQPDEMAMLAAYCNNRFSDGSEPNFTAMAMAKHYSAFTSSRYYQMVGAQPMPEPEPEPEDNTPPTPEQKAYAEKLHAELLKKVSGK